MITYPNNYVMGFVFDEPLEHVILIQKQKPAWQKGKLNGVGGKIEPNEFPLDAMIREFKEETGLYISPWSYLGKLHGLNTDGDRTGFQVQMFMSVQTLYTLNKAESKTEEQVRVYPVKDIPYVACIPNLKWIIPFCLYPYNTTIEVQYFD
jgi:8-oxo-dGTP diphosphatase